jgi:DNA-binding CsgD family transcriptional regulator
MSKIVKVIYRLLKKSNHNPIIIYFGPRSSKPHFMPKILNTPGTEWENVFCENWCELENALKNKTHALIIHHSYVINANNNIHQSIINIVPLIKIKNKHPNLRLSLAVDRTTTFNVIKEIFGLGVIKNIVPSCIDFGFKDYMYGVGAILHQTYYCPSRIIDFLPWFNFNINYSKNNVCMTLTPRQTEIAALISKNHYSNKQIAKILGISESSVKSHLVKIFKKHNITNRLQLSNTLLQLK